MNSKVGYIKIVNVLILPLAIFIFVNKLYLDIVLDGIHSFGSTLGIIFIIFVFIMFIIVILKDYFQSKLKKMDETIVPYQSRTYAIILVIIGLSQFILGITLPWLIKNRFEWINIASNIVLLFIVDWDIAFPKFSKKIEGFLEFIRRILRYT
ncbi:MAG: hypothetical protein JXA99_04480 [Candidatus Lokiarchaeota archaeon]|nr:hypothetical protein [Candidatus Lokiarchaeota archaeon]